MSENFKSGFIAIIGRPNVGKSTFINQVIGEKIAITSDKPQTTRNKIQGVFTEEDCQMIFIDTPGIHKPKHRLGNEMVQMAKSTLHEVDLIMFMIHAEEGYGKGDEYILERLQQVDTPVFLVINQVDLIQPDELLPIIDLYKDKAEFNEIVPISALQGNNVSHLLEVIKHYLPEGPKYYDDEQVTDQPERHLISELIREKVLHHTREEIPHSITVTIDQIKNRGSRPMLVQATIITEKNSQKGILIGKQGKMLKRIGQEARQDIESLLGTKIFLDLWVKVQKDWRNNERLIKHYGLQNLE